jgi:lysophospholipase L1-like esterase
LDAYRLTGLANDDLLATWTDFSGNNKHATAAGAARPTYKAGSFNGLPSILFDGAATYMTIPAIDLTTTQAVTIFAVFIAQAGINTKMILDSGFNAARTITLYHSMDGGVQNLRTVSIVVGNIGSSYHYNGMHCSGSPEIAGVILNVSASPDIARTYIDKILTNSATLVNNTDAGLLNTTLVIGRRKSVATSYFKGYIGEIILYDRALADHERIIVEDYLLAKWTSTVDDNPHDNAYSTDFLPNYTLRSTLSRIVFDTEATELTVEYYTNIFAMFPLWAQIGVVVDGVYTDTLTATINNEAHLGSITGLAPGTKRVELINGVQSSPAGTILGTFVQKVRANGPARLIVPHEPLNRMIVYGDSITEGGNSVTPTQQAWTILIRNLYGGDLAVEAYGYRGLYNDAIDAAARTAFVARLVAAYTPDIIWICIGTNDYGLSLWNAANFGVAYAALLDELHIEFPATTIYAQTMIQRTAEGPNGFGNTCGDYRTQIVNACGTRPWATLIDGTAVAFPQAPGDLGDGVHPTTAGHIKYRDAVRGILGF